MEVGSCRIETSGRVTRRGGICMVAQRAGLRPHAYGTYLGADSACPVDMEAYLSYGKLSASINLPTDRTRTLILLGYADLTSNLNDSWNSQLYYHSTIMYGNIPNWIEKWPIRSGAQWPWNDDEFCPCTRTDMVNYFSEKKFLNFSKFYFISKFSVVRIDDSLQFIYTRLCYL